MALDLPCIKGTPRCNNTKKWSTISLFRDRKRFKHHGEGQRKILRLRPVCFGVELGFNLFETITDKDARISSGRAFQAVGASQSKI